MSTLETTIGYTAVMGLREDLNLKGQEYGKSGVQVSGRLEVLQKGPVARPFIVSLALAAPAFFLVSRTDFLYSKSHRS